MRDSAPRPGRSRCKAWIPRPGGGRGIFLGCLLAFAVGAAAADLPDDDYQVETKTLPGEMRVKQGPVNYRPGGGTELAAQPPQGLDFGDGLRTLERARATVRLTDLSGLRLNEFTRLEIVRPVISTHPPGVFLQAGEVYVSSSRLSPSRP